MFHQQAYVDGAWIDADNGQTTRVNNPTTGKIVDSVPKIGAAETRHAIEAADKALPVWRVLTVKERVNRLRRWFGLMIEDQDDLARLMTIEQGKPLAEAKDETIYTASFLEWFGGEAKRIYGDTIPGHQPDKRIIAIKQPIGVTTAITSQNLPSAMITRKAGPALAASCTMVLKPASQTPYSALTLAELTERTDISKNVFGVVTGSAGEVSGELTSNPIVRKLTLTSSTEVGRQLTAECAQDIKKVSLELGGNVPFTVFGDVDPDVAAEGVLISRYRNNGQICVCVNRLYAQDGVYDASVDKLKVAMAKLNVDNGLEADVTTGPLIDTKAMAKAEEHTADAVSKDARVILGGKPHALGGIFFGPTILVDVSKNTLVLKGETFDPLAPVFRLKDEAEVIAMFNDTGFGLVFCFYVRDLAHVFRVTERLECGMVGIDTGLISNGVVPFDGIKASGLGRGGSKYRIEDYLEIKYLYLGGI